MSIERNQSLVLDCSWFMNRGKLTKRDFNLDKFGLSSEIKRIRTPTVSRIIRGTLQASRIIVPELYGKIREENPFKYDGALLKARYKNLWLNGYFQSFRYFAQYGDVLSRELVVKKKALSEKDLSLIQTARATNSVSLHVRRGDYQNSSADIVTLAYYRNALHTIQERSGRCVVLIFSDDPKWVKENLQLNSECIFVDHNDESRCTNDLEIMTHCKHCIIANSSFSWWGAWLGSQANKEQKNGSPRMVVCPELWWDGLYYANLDVYPENWIKIPVK